jgi:hypothetical protein
MIGGMNPGFLLLLLVACLLGLLPVWRLATAGWPPRALVMAWLVYGTAIVLTVRFFAPMRFLVPILVLAYVAPFVAGPERLTRALKGRRRDAPPIVDVTPRPAPGLPDGGRGAGDERRTGDEPGADGHGDTDDGPGAPR